ncbi:AMP-binding protein [Actinoplanes sp. NPDC049548]|uniref:AMP-binding protein n=1 Tax=Actinoplanes sp. NPDC049548 TaxID=3155152 RepID=UPI003440B20E
MFLRHFDDHPALVDAATGTLVTYAELQTRVSTCREWLGDADSSLMFLFADNSVRTIVAYLAGLHYGHAVALLDPGLRSDLAARLIDTYHPRFIVGRDPGLAPDYRCVTDGVARRTATAVAISPELAVLLSTSGSTGSPKLVRLSRGNLMASAEAVAASLSLTRDERPVTSLPLHYSYGMSVLNSHLQTGATIVVAEPDLLAPRFWDTVSDHRVTSMSGVPFTFRTLRRIGFESMDLPALTTLTQAGGRLDERLVTEFDALMRARGGRFYVMYGQTEASPRITCLPPHRLADKRGSVGVALPGTRVLIRTADDSPAPPGVAGAVLCTGPHVMMGYAESRADLALGDVQGDTLDTGDVGYLDDEGFLFLTGRTKRIAKVSGVRVSLDEIEVLLGDHGPSAALPGMTEDVVIHCAWGDEATFAAVRRELCGKLRLPSRAFTFVRVENLPLLANGKTDYRALEAGVPA